MRRTSSFIDLSLTPSPPTSPRRGKSPSLPNLAKVPQPRPRSSSNGRYPDLMVPSRVIASSLSPAPRPSARPRTKTIRIASSSPPPQSSPPRLVRAISTVSSANLPIPIPTSTCTSSPPVPQRPKHRPQRNILTSSQSAATRRGNSAEPIDLCSSEDEPPAIIIKSSRAVRPVPSSSQVSTRSQVTTSSKGVAISKRPTRRAAELQTRLDLPVVARRTVGMAATKVVEDTRPRGRFVDDPVWDV